MDTAAIVNTLRRDAQRSVFRARNGIKYVGGIGRPTVGASPRRTIWSGGKAQLWRFESDVREPGRPPLVIVFSTLGRSYVLDLMPGASFVERLLAAGTDLFLVDFGVPDDVDAGNTLETYVDGYLPRAFRAAARASGHEQIDVLGYCFGGMLTALSVAGNPKLPVRTLITMAAPIDFSRIGGVLSVFRRGRLEVEDVVDHTGNIPAEAIDRMFRAMKPTADLTTYAALWEKLWNDDFVTGFQAMNRWVHDQVPFPGAFAEQCVDLLLRRNALVADAVPLGAREVRLSDITCPVLCITAERDHIVPPPPPGRCWTSSAVPTSQSSPSRPGTSGW